jgi:hypothetical protein
MPRKDIDRHAPDEIWRIVSVAEIIGRTSPGSSPATVDRSDWRPPSPRGDLAMPFILDMVALYAGLIALMLMLFASIPFIAMANWLIAPIAVAGLGLGLLSGNAAGRNLNLLVLLFALLIWSLGN